MIRARQNLAHALFATAHRYERGQLTTGAVRRLMRHMERFGRNMRDEQARRFFLRIDRLLLEVGRDIQRGSPDPARRMQLAQALRAKGQRMSNLRM